MTLQEQIRANRVRSALLLLSFGLVFVAIGFAVQLAYGLPALIIIAGIAFIYAIVSWFANGAMIASWTGARAVTKDEYPDFVRAVENASIGAGLTVTPQVRVVDDPCPNAFAAGGSPKQAYVTATTGLLAMMNKRELESVVAHEIGHIRNRDVRLMSLVAVLVGVIALISDLALRYAFFGGTRRRSNDGGNPIFIIVGLALMILAPIAAFGIQMALSRKREYLADESSAEITGDPEGLAMALRKLKADTQELRHVNRATAHLYIETPLNNAQGLRSSLSGLFDTHPSLDARIEALEKAGGFMLA
jgi:heat shock protein HtpX